MVKVQQFDQLNNNEIQILQQSTLLYAEDDLELRDSVCRILSYYFKNIHVASDGAEAIMLFDNNHIDIAILDIKMPKLSGVDVASHIHNANQKIPIFIMTSYHEHEDLIKFIKIGIIDYLLKPFKLQDLKNALAKSISFIQENNRLQYEISQNISYDIKSKTLYNNCREIKLSKSERIVLELLLVNKANVVKYEIIEEELMEVGEGSRGTIKNIICKLRNKLDGQNIDNIQFVGYVLR